MGVSPLKGEDPTPRPGAEGSLEQVTDRIFEAWKENHDE